MTDGLLRDEQAFLFRGTCGIAGPLAAWDSGRVCCPFVLGFGNWKTI